MDRFAWMDKMYFDILDKHSLWVYSELYITNVN